MPTSVKDRFNESGEELYFFVKNKKYWCDLDAVRLPNQYQGIFDFRPISLKIGATRGMGEGYPESKYNKFNYRVRDAERKVGQPQFRASEEEIKKYRVKTIIDPNIKGLRQAPEPGESNAFNIMGKNIPTIWQINPEPHNFQKELDVDIDHFAVFPEALCEIPIKFGCPKLVCKKCGRAREKIFNDIDKRHWTERQRKTKKGMELNRTGQRNDLGGSFKTKQREFSGLSNCGCNAGFEPGIVLDPFCGSGTALVVAKKLSRNYVGIELNKNYCEIAQKRLNQIPKPLF